MVETPRRGVSTALLLCLTVLVVFACGGNSQSTASQSATPTPSGGPTPLAVAVFVSIPHHQTDLAVEIAATPERRARGLMSRQSLPENQGMLFSFETQTEAAFWMKDTTIPLSIAFISDEGGILGIQDMQPLSLELHRAPGPYSFAIEVNQGWFKRNGINVLDSVRIIYPQP